MLWKQETERMFCYHNQHGIKTSRYCTVITTAFILMNHLLSLKAKTMKLLRSFLKQYKNWKINILKSMLTRVSTCMISFLFRDNYIQYGTRYQRNSLHQNTTKRWATINYISQILWFLTQRSCTSQVVSLVMDICKNCLKPNTFKLLLRS